MTFLTINGHDYSMYVNELKVSRSSTYRSQTNAAGNTVVDNMNAKRSVTIGIIPLSDSVMAQLLEDVYRFEVLLSFRNPQTGVLEEGVRCIVPDSEIEYYTLSGASSVMYNAFNITFNEL